MTGDEMLEKTIRDALSRAQACEKDQAYTECRVWVELASAALKARLRAKRTKDEEGGG